MKILVRLPNWLGDMVMSTGFINKCTAVFGVPAVDVIVKDEFAELARRFLSVDNVYSFCGNDLSGFNRMRRFAAQFKGRYDMYFALPDSFSSALLGFLTAAPERIGYSGQFRSFLFSKHYRKPADLHRAEEYAWLLKDYADDPCSDINVSLPALSAEDLPTTEIPKEGIKILLNINSSGTSRRIPLPKAAAIASGIIEKFDPVIILTGSIREAEYTRRLQESVANGSRLINVSGKTSLDQLASIVAMSDLIISADSGIAHLANSMGKPTVVLFGAGDENNTAPYNKDKLCVIKPHGLDCTPCVKNECRYGSPICIERLEEEDILNCAARFLSGTYHV